MENRDTFTVELNVEIKQEDIDNIMAMALESGIGYWCKRVTPLGMPLGEFAKDQISKGGALLLDGPSDGEPHILTKEKLLEGIKMYAEQPHSCEIITSWQGKWCVNSCGINAKICDLIVQYALFDQIVYE